MIGWKKGVRERVKKGKTSASGVIGKYMNERRMVDVCAERALCVGNTYSKHTHVRKHTKVDKGKVGMEVHEGVAVFMSKVLLVRSRAI